jgi:polyphenol oxidase
MFVRSNAGVYESTLLRKHAWLRHGFASRQADPWPGDYTRIKQIHSNIVAVARDGEDLPEHGDAIVTRDPAGWVGIRTADCVPVLIADPIHQVVGAIHAGWRGTVAEIASRTVETMVSEFGSEPQTLIAAIGPCIAECCFEVGPEVGQHFEHLFPERTDFRHVNLPEANRRQLRQAGLAESNIDMSSLCTVCDPADFHSYRRDRELSGRMVAAIQIVRT